MEAPFAFDEADNYLSKDDILILPEYDLQRLLAMVKNCPARIGVNNQNGFYALYFRPKLRELKSRIEFSMACSPFAAITSHRCYGMKWKNIFQTPYWMVRPPFDLEGQALIPSFRSAICHVKLKRLPIRSWNG
jgi:hypothetical protein